MRECYTKQGEQQLIQKAAFFFFLIISANKLKRPFQKISINISKRGIMIKICKIEKKKQKEN